MRDGGSGIGASEDGVGDLFGERLDRARRQQEDQPEQGDQDDADAAPMLREASAPTSRQPASTVSTGTAQPLSRVLRRLPAPSSRCRRLRWRRATCSPPPARRRAAERRRPGGGGGGSAAGAKQQRAGLSRGGDLSLSSLTSLWCGLHGSAPGRDDLDEVDVGALAIGDPEFVGERVGGAAASAAVTVTSTAPEPGAPTQATARRSAASGRWSAG